METVLAIVFGGGILYATFEKFLNHRAEMARIRAEAQSAENAAIERQVERLRAEVQGLKERLDEQAILIDDVQRLSPRTEQRLNG